MEAKLAVGLLSVLAAILSSLQTFFKFSERAEKHRLFAARFGSVRREFEGFYAAGSVENEPNYLNVLRDKLDRLAEEAPHVPSTVFSKVQKNILYTDQGSTFSVGTPPAGQEKHR